MGSDPSTPRDWLIVRSDETLQAKVTVVVGLARSFALGGCLSDHVALSVHDKNKLVGSGAVTVVDRINTYTIASWDSPVV